MKTSRPHAVLAGLLLIGTAAPANAQYAAGMNGRANDASNLVGSGGINTPVAPSFFNSANLYITGNVSRGGYFRGNSPIRDTSSLFTPLPSSAMGDFQRDAIDVRTATSSPTPWLATPYYNPYQTAAPLSAIRAGQTQFGTSSVRSYTGFQPYDTASVGPNPLDLNAVSRPLYGTAPNSSIYTPENLSMLRGNDLYDRLRLTNETRRLRDSAVFGRNPYALPDGDPSASEPRRLADPYALDRTTIKHLPVDPLVRQSRTALEDSQRNALNRPNATAPDLLTPAALAPKLLAGPTSLPPQRDLLTGRPVTPTETPDTTPQVAGTTLTPGPLASPPVPSLLPPSAQPQTGTPQDPRPLSGLAIPTGTLADADQPALGLDATGTNPLLDLSRAVSFLQEVEENPQLRERVDATPTLRDQYDRARSIVRSTSQNSVPSLAGTGTSRVDELMREAEAKSREGDYYQASTYFGLAATMAPDNPLVRLGYGHALAAAGEYVTAVLNIEQAVEAYPAFGFLRLDLNEFVRDPTDLDLRRADLEQRLEKREDFRLRFLLGYVEYYSGFEKFGLPNLHKAAEAAPAGSVIARFPEILKAPAKFLSDPSGAIPQAAPGE